MKCYIGVKRVNAVPMNREEYNKFRGLSVPADENPSDEGLLVEYVDGGKANTPHYAGYVSWSPKDVFERAYRPSNGMSFGDAIEVLKTGHKISRCGWNGKGMFLWLKPSTTILASYCKDSMLAGIVEDNGGSILALGTICMFPTIRPGAKPFLPVGSHLNQICSPRIGWLFDVKNLNAEKSGRLIAFFYFVVSFI